MLLAWGTLELGRGYWLRIHGGYDDPQVMPLASEIAAHTRSDDLVGTVGLDWSPAVLYYAHRRGNMVTAHARDAGLDAIHDDGYRYLLVAEPEREDLGLDGPVAMGRRARSASLRARRRRAPPAAHRSPRHGPRAEPGGQARSTLRPSWDAPGALKCSAGTRIRAGRAGTWLSSQRLPPGLACRSTASRPFPRDAAVFASPALARNGTLVVSCAGREELSLVRVLDAPAPR